MSSHVSNNSILDPVTFWNQANKSLIRYGGDFAPKIIVRAKGCCVYDEQDNAILDFTSGQMSAILGHSHPDITACIEKNLPKLVHLFSGFLSPPVVQLATELSDLLPDGLDKTLFLSTGGEANEAALRMAKVYTNKYECVAFSSSWHGVTGGAASLTFAAARRGYGPALPGSYTIPEPNPKLSPFRDAKGNYDWQKELDYSFYMLDKQSTGSLACMIVETILSTGGIIELPQGYLKALKKKCEERGMLLIIDEAQTGIGRTGSMFSFEHHGIVPDILTLSKSLGAGTALAAVITSEEIEKVCYDNGFVFYTTHASDPLPAAIGSTVLKVVKRDNLVEKAKISGELLRSNLLRLKDKHPLIVDVRGRGLLQGIEIASCTDPSKPSDFLGTVIGDKCLELGMNCNIVHLRGIGGVFRIAPPLTVTDEEIHKAIEIFDSALTFTAKEFSGSY